MTGKGPLCSRASSTPKSERPSPVSSIPAAAYLVSCVRGYSKGRECLNISVRQGKNFRVYSLCRQVGQRGQVASNISPELNLTQYLILLLCVRRENAFAGYGKRVRGELLDF